VGVVIVDSHQHLWRVDQGYGWLDEPSLAPIRRSFGTAELEAELVANGVDRSVLVEGGRCDTDEAAILLAHALAAPRIAGVVAWGDLEDPGLSDTIATYRGLPGGELLVGIRAQLQGESDPSYLERPGVRDGLRVVGEQGLVFDLVVRADQLRSAARCARDLPGVSFVLDHLGKPGIRGGEFAAWAADLRQLAASPNVTAKLSGLVTEAAWDSWTVDLLRPYVEMAFEVFGVDRLMFGSDWPVCTLAGGYRAWIEALRELVPDGARDAVFGQVAVRTYGLGPE
jgi:L-fuconolactonase